MLYQVTIAEQTDLRLTLVEVSQDRFSRDGSHSLTPSTKKIHSQFGVIFLWFIDLTLAEDMYCDISFNKIGWA